LLSDETTMKELVPLPGERLHFKARLTCWVSRFNETEETVLVCFDHCPFVLAITKHYFA